MGNRPQGIINDKILKHSDILIGIFWTRIGSPTGKAISGSVEEIDEHIKSGKPTMLYFSNKPVNPDSIDLEQHSAVKDLKKQYQLNGINTDFSSLDEFKTKLQRQISIKLNEEKYLIPDLEVIETKTEFNSVNIVHNLSKDAEFLLKEASKDPNGEIMKLSYSGGFTFQINGKQMNEDFSQRTKAKWEAAMDELLKSDLISKVGSKGAIFHITNNGYKVADELN